VEKVKRAKHLPPPPEGFKDREFTVLVPIVFKLE
jgi:outer membrane biosynthesis protein TonB